MEPVRSYWYESYRRYWYRVLQARKHPDYRLSLSWVCGFFGTIILLGSAYTAGSAINTVWTDSILNCDLLFSLNATCPYSTIHKTFEMGWTVTQTRMLVAFWSAIAFCIGIILIYFSYLNYQKHKELKRKNSVGSSTRRPQIGLDSMLRSERRVSHWRTTPRNAPGTDGAPAVESDDVLTMGPPQYTGDKRDRHVSFAAERTEQRQGGDACMDWSEEIW